MKKQQRGNISSSSWAFQQQQKKNVNARLKPIGVELFLGYVCDVINEFEFGYGFRMQKKSRRQAAKNVHTKSEWVLVKTE